MKYFGPQIDFIASNMAIEIDEPNFLENFLHYGLLLGAAFQLVCIFAVIFIPKSENEQVAKYINFSMASIVTVIQREREFYCKK
jgi:hypothetical protein